jgi:hypothetical protein
MVKLVLWYDNEWGYACRVVDQVLYVGERLSAGDTGEGGMAAAVSGAPAIPMEPRRRRRGAVV